MSVRSSRCPVCAGIVPTIGAFSISTTERAAATGVVNSSDEPTLVGGIAVSPGQTTPVTRGVETGAFPHPASGTGPLIVGQKFGGRYLITRLLGIGGMGAVYRAWDAKMRSG